MSRSYQHLLTGMPAFSAGLLGLFCNLILIHFYDVFPSPEGHKKVQGSRARSESDDEPAQTKGKSERDVSWKALVFQRDGNCCVLTRQGSPSLQGCCC
ncbi:hypothetical protein N7490_006200 [Penicillium lividum]|nr:hypothetical protein N7490_006200 [Penicillium lividum]